MSHGHHRYRWRATPNCRSCCCCFSRTEKHCVLYSIPFYCFNLFGCVFSRLEEKKKYTHANCDRSAFVLMRRRIASMRSDNNKQICKQNLQKHAYIWHNNNNNNPVWTQNVFFFPSLSGTKIATTTNIILIRLCFSTFDDLVFFFFFFVCSIFPRLFYVCLLILQFTIIIDSHRIGCTIE